MTKKLKKYKVSPDESLCLAVSVVDKPAVESDFIYLAKHQIEKFVGVDGERRMIYGCALRPDFPIYRNNGKEEYYLEFSKEAIDKISKNYFKMGFQSNWTEAHKDDVEGLTITESWIKEDLEKDKSVALGFGEDLPIGSWILGVHCENDDIWQSVKDGTYHGFSVEAVIGVEEFEEQIKNIEKENINLNMNEETFFSKLKSIIREALGKEEEVNVELEEQTPTSETVEATPEAVETETTTEVEDTTSVIDKEVTEENPDEGKPVEVPDGATVDVNKLSELIDSLKAEIEALKDTNSNLEKKVKKMSTTPSTKPVNVNGKTNAEDNYANWRAFVASTF